MDNVHFLYRYEDQMTYPNTINIKLRKFRVVKWTPCGYWIQVYDFDPDYKKWVSKNGRKRFAYPTVEQAETNFIARKQKQILILESRLRQAKNALQIVSPESIPNSNSRRNILEL